MKNITQAFKTQIKTMGREIDASITYSNVELGAEEINNISLSYEGSILKSVMKKLEIDVNEPIPLETVINFQFGIKVNGSYEYIDYGNFVVYKQEKQEDTKSYVYTCYDKILYSMKNYENINYTFPMTVRSYIDSVCTTLGLTFANASDTFANYDKVLTEDFFLDAEGSFLGYTFRDVLDQLAEVTASTICINDDDELEIRYITNSGDTIDESFLKDVNVKFGEKYGPVNSIVLSRSAGADNIYLKDDTSIGLNGLCEIKIVDNQIMNGNNRDEFLSDILDVLDGLEYYINDYSSTGITYYDLCDRYNVTVGNTTYSCIMFNDEININQGLQENVFTEMPEDSETDYAKADKTDRKINQAYAIVDKQNNKITNFVSQTTQTQELNNQRILELTERTNSVEQILTSTQATINVMQDEIIDGQQNLRNSLVTIDINGINVSTNQSAIETMITNERFVIMSGDTPLAYFGYDSTTNSTKAEMDNLTVTNYFIAGYHRVEKFRISGENRTGYFYIG